MKFRIEHGGARGHVHFELLAEDGSLLLRGFDLPDREACIAAIRETIARLSDPACYSERLDQVATFLELSGPAGPLARSGPLSGAPEAARLRLSVIEAARQQREYQISLPPRWPVSAALPAVRWSQTAREELYDVTRPSLSGQPGFEPFQSETNGRFYFHFNGPDGQAILYSRGFPTASARNERLRAVIENAPLTKRYERRHEGGLHYFILKARNSQEIARSRQYDATELEAGKLEADMAFVQQQAQAYAASYAASYARRGETRDQYNLELMSRTGVAGFETFRDPVSKLHYFVFNDEGGRPLLLSQGYQARAGRDHGLRALIRNSRLAAHYELREENGQHLFILRAANRQELARSRGFTSAAELAGVVDALRVRLPACAAAYGVVLGALETLDVEHLTLEVDPAAPGPGAADISDGVEPPSAAPEDDWDEEGPDTVVRGITEVLEESRQEVETPRIPEPPLEPAPAPAPAPAAASSPRRDARSPWPLVAAVVVICLLLLFGAWRFRPAAPDDVKTQLAGAARPENTEPHAPLAAPVSAASPTPGPAPVSPASPASPATPQASAPAPPPAPPPSAPSALPLNVSSLPAGSMEVSLAEFLRHPEGPFPRVFTMDRLQYPPDSHDINAAGKEEIYFLAQVLNAHPEAEIEVRGFTDGVESETYHGPDPHRGYTLSRLRAHCVYRRLVNLGVSPDRLHFRGLGKDAPVTEERSPEGLQRNRRVEIVIRRAGSTR